MKVYQNGLYYGISLSGGANGIGTAFTFDPSTATVTTLHDFAPADGLNPDTLAAGNGGFYGFTVAGGPAQAGTIFQLNPTTGNVTNLHSFGQAEGGIPNGDIAFNGTELYGVAQVGGCPHGRRCQGTVFGLDLRSNSFKRLAVFRMRSGVDNGAFPHGGVSYLAGALYGTTLLGGPADGGAVFEVTP